MYINVNDLLVFLAAFLGACLIAAIGVLLIICLIRFNRTIKKVNKLIDDNAENVGKTLKQLPDLAENLSKAGASVDQNAEKVGNSIVAISTVFTGDSDGEGDSSTLMTIMSIAESVLKVVMNFFANKDKD
jgi:predicted PurR-regulated permease PerM